MCTVLLPPGYNPIAVNKYVSYHIKVPPTQQNVRHHNIVTANGTFENEGRFKYLGTTPTNQNWTHEKNYIRLNSGNVSYMWIQNILSFRSLYKNS